MAFEHAGERMLLATNEKELLYQIRKDLSDLKVTEYDLKMPTSNFVIEFYKKFLSEFFIDPNTIMQIQLCQATMLAEYSDMYNEVLPLMNLTNAVKSFKIPALKNFCIYDLINPTPKRTFNHLSNVMLFYNFSDARVTVLVQKLEKKKVLQERKKMMLKNIDEMKQMYNARVVDIENKRIAFKEKEAEMERLNAETDNLQDMKDSSSSEWNKIKFDYEEISSKYKDALQQSEMLNNDIKELSNHIRQLKDSSNVFDSASEMLSSEILEEKVKQTSETLAHMRESLTLKQTYMEELTKCQNNFSSNTLILKEISQYIDVTMEFEQKRNEVAKKINEISQHIEKIKSSGLLMEQELLKKREELTGLRLQWSKQKSSLLESLNFAKSNFEEWERKNLAKIESDKEIKMYQQKMLENESAYETLLNGIEHEKIKRDKEMEDAINEIIEFIDAKSGHWKPLQ